MNNPPRFMEYLCSQMPTIILLFAFTIAGTVLNTASLLFVGPKGTPLVAINYIGLTAMFFGSGYTIWRCRQM